MIDRLKGFWESIAHFFSFFNDMIADITFFVPPYIQGALYMFFFFAGLILAIKFVKGLIEVVKTVLTSIFFFFL